MTDHGTPPSIPTELQIYDSYAEDPKWQRKFSIIWATVVTGAIFFSLPHLLKSVRKGKAFVGFGGVREEWGLRLGEEKQSTVERRGPIVLPGKLAGMLSTISSTFRWTLPGLRLNLGQSILVVAYLVTVLLCVTTGAQLATNSNRAGFLAVAQLPPLYLFATKNSVLAFLLGPGQSYQTLSPYHRIAGFSTLILSFIHGSLWISSHLTWNIPILGQQKETSGVAAMACVGIFGVTSVRFMREGTVFKALARLAARLGVIRLASFFETLAGLSYEWFWVVHILVSCAFFITLCYHTIYVTPWIFPPLAFLGADIFMRMARLKMKDAQMWPVDDQMTIIQIPHATSGWIPGQHVRLRVFFGGGRVFESHPLTILNASANVSCLGLPNTDLGFDTNQGPGILLGARVSGDWTRALNEFAKAERLRHVAEAQTEFSSSPDHLSSDKEVGVCCATTPADVPQTSALELPQLGGTALSIWGLPIPALVSTDGPYGGSSIDLGEYETVLLMAGGSGVTFTLGMLDDLIGRVVAGRRQGEKTRKVEFVWCMKSFGSIDWFAPLLKAIALAAASTHPFTDTAVYLHISVYVTCLCSPDSVPDIPNMDVTVAPRPDVSKILRELIEPTGVSSDVENTLTSADEATNQRAHSPTDSISTVSSSEELKVPRDLEWGPHAVIPCRLPNIPLGGGIGICASGPESLTREVNNATSRLTITNGMGGLGRVGVHTEIFKI
ncbi:ferric-chelate reductase Frp1 [Stygiomarasmius scandens]|uniref:Ferric-chelate reductase Frp1 n=1 Tax=Marasmiellus scandens TaxID=2682957 RepID=A0ABR1K0H8_9AGAR